MKWKVFNVIFFNKQLEEKQLCSFIFFLVTLCSLIFLPEIIAQDYFPLSALEISNSEQAVIDLSSFSIPGGQLPGTYRVTVFLNGAEKENRDINFVQKNGKLFAALTVDDLKRLGVKTAAFPELLKLPAKQILYNIEDYIPYATILFDFHQQRLEINIPQAVMDNLARDTVPTDLWQQGESAFLSSYDFSGLHNHNRNASSQNYYLNLHNGINIGAWRFRNQLVYNYDSQRGKNNLSSVNSYIQRDIHKLKSQIVLGETFTNNDVFDSIKFVGASIISDDLMLPTSQRDFAPVIRGIAQTNARVTVRQNSYIIYENYVPPGPFVITDLYAIYGSGNLHITVTEDNGKQVKFIQPFSSVPIMQREGKLKYQFTLGRYANSKSNFYKPYFSELASIYGVSNRLSVLSGIQAAENYLSLSLGLGLGLDDFGAFFFNVVFADTNLPNNKHKKGQSYKIQYEKSIDKIGTSFNFSANLYTSSEYYSFPEINRPLRKQDAENGQNKLSQFQFKLNQNMEDFGHFYFSAYWHNYRRKKGTTQSFSAGYNINIADITFGLNVFFNKNDESTENKDKQIAFNVSVPFSKWLPSGWITYNINNNTINGQQLAINGSLSDNDDLLYNVRVDNNYKSLKELGGGISLNYTNSLARMNVGYNYNNNDRSFNYGLSGGVIVHRNGIVFSQPLGETVILVKADGAVETKILNHRGVKTDGRGYAVIPYSEPYNYNYITLDTESLDNGVDIDNPVQKVVPTRGAVAKVNFHVRRGNRILVKLSQNNKPVPFGAIATLIDGDSHGIVGDDGELYLNAVPDLAKIRVQWGKDEKQQCYFKVDLSKLPRESDILEMNANCYTLSHFSA